MFAGVICYKGLIVLCGLFVCRCFVVVDLFVLKWWGLYVLMGLFSLGIASVCFGWGLLCTGATGCRLGLIVCFDCMFATCCVFVVIPGGKFADFGFVGCFMVSMF